MTTVLYAAVSPGEVRVAAVTSGVLQDFLLWRPGRPDGVDDLYRGRVRAVARELAGCFVALGDQDGFLPDSLGGKGLSEGDFVAVRVTRAAQAGKGARLTAQGVAAASGPPGLIARGPGALRELAALYPAAAIRLDDRALFADVRAEFGARIALVPQAFDDALAAEVDGLFETSVALAGGGLMHIEPTRALVAIDLDSGLGGGGLSGGGGGGGAVRAQAHLAANRAVLAEVARQIRLRELAGTIMVDFAGLPAKKRVSLGPELARLLAQDPRAPRLVGFTGLGLAEISRTRRHPPLHELAVGPHARGLAALRQAAQMLPEVRLRLRAEPAIVAALQADATALASFQRRAVYPMQLIADPSLPAPGYAIEEIR